MIITEIMLIVIKVAGRQEDEIGKQHITELLKF
jgi:hypothetical protein